MRVLITGCGGFLGREVARQLAVRGDQVVGLVRRHSPDLDAALGCEQKLADIRDSSAVTAACQGMDAVIHTAAVAGVWGPWQHYFETNTLGTRNCLSGCKKWGVPILVYCSSPSVTFDGKAQSGINEEVPYPQRWLCHYPHSKAIAEQEVLAAHTPQQFHTLALRPHLIWGAEDPHLIPRLVQRARAGRLAIVGSGQNLIDTVHVVNAARAHVLALDSLSSGEQAGGRAYFVSQDEPVNCWQWIGSLLSLAGLGLPSRRVSFRAAYAIGATLEAVYHLMGRAAEPPMTRFVAAQLALDHWFDLSAIKQALGYQPMVSSQTGLDEIRALWETQPPAWLHEKG
jgi:2-alkyl-3-oxoalkanoate reductase